MKRCEIDGRTFVEVGGYEFIEKKIILFMEWMNQRFGSYDKFLKLGFKDKEKMFLRWKWGFQDDRANEQCEITEKGILFQFKDADLDALSSKALAFALKEKRNFDAICFKVRQEIGLYRKDDPMVDRVTKQFDAKEY